MFLSKLVSIAGECMNDCALPLCGHIGRAGIQLCSCLVVRFWYTYQLVGPQLLLLGGTSIFQLMVSIW